jgi:tetratricopeptide (TPR) repeat protein
MLVFGVTLTAMSSRVVNAQPTSKLSTRDTIVQITAALQQRSFGEALAESGTALRSTPLDYRVWTLRAMAYSGLGNQAAAFAVFEHALKVEPSYLPALEGAAQLKYQQGSQDAKPFLERILAQHPNDSTTHAMLAALDYRKKDCAGAVEQFRQAAAAISTLPDALGEYGTCLAMLKRFEEAIPVLQQALSVDSTAQATSYNLALSQWNANRPTEALSTLQPLLAKDSVDKKVMLLAAGIYESTKDTQRAIDLLRKAIIDDPQDPEAYLQIAYLSYDHGSPKVGIDFLNAGLTQMPAEPHLYLVRGILYCQFGEFAKAMTDFQTANRLDPKLSFVDVSMGVVESQEHNSAAALAQFRAAAKKHPNDALTQYLFAEALSHQEHPDELEEIDAANRALRADPNLIAAHDFLANIYLHKGLTQQAIAHSEAALAVDPNDQQALFHLVLALRRTNRKGEIPELLKRINDNVQRAQQTHGAPKTGIYQLSEVPQAK